MNWKTLIKSESEKDYFKSLTDFILKDSEQHIIYPPHKNIYKAFNLTPFNKVKVVVLGQDPYINENQAQGLAFSVPKDCQIPPSLKNIFKEINSDLNQTHQFTHGNLEGWAKQGVLLLNTTLTVRAGQSNSHKDKGWEIFTDKAISLLNDHPNNLVFILWGASAKSKSKLITNTKHLIITAAHPSPLSAHNGFFGSKCFSKCNEFLINNNIVPINWFDT